MFSGALITIIEEAASSGLIDDTCRAPKDSGKREQPRGLSPKAIKNFRHFEDAKNTNMGHVTWRDALAD